jgi:hypothetical protein
LVVAINDLPSCHDLDFGGLSFAYFVFATVGDPLNCGLGCSYWRFLVMVLIVITCDPFGCDFCCNY